MNLQILFPHPSLHDQLETELFLLYQHGIIFI